MKPNLFALLLPVAVVFCIFTTSCHKTKHPAAPTTKSPISGLTGVGFRSRLFLAPDYPKPYIIWNFSGTDTITATPDTLASYFGYQKLFFSGSKPSQLVYNSMYTITYYENLTTTITYTATGLIDSMTFQYASPVSNAKAAFQYNGNQVSKIIVAGYNSGPDTFAWGMPYIYTFTYTGNNISQIKVISPGDSFIYNYPADTRKNNFAGSMSTFLQLAFLEQTTSVSDFFLSMPIYLNANFVTDSNTTVLTDASGRIVERITTAIDQPFLDTFYYYY